MAGSAFTDGFFLTLSDYEGAFHGHCGPINKTAWDPNGRPDLPQELCQPGSPTDGTPLPFVLECLLYPTYGSQPSKKLPQKPGAFK